MTALFTSCKWGYKHLWTAQVGHIGQFLQLRGLKLTVCIHIKVSKALVRTCCATLGKSLHFSGLVISFPLFVSSI